MKTKKGDHSKAAQVSIIKKSIKYCLVTAVLIITALAMAGCTPPQSEQSEIHVAVNGSDESGNGTKSKPYASVAKAAQAAPGSLIVMHAGEYGSIELGPVCSGRKDSPTVIRAADGEKVIIRAEKNIGISLKDVNHITIEGLETEGGTHGIRYISTRKAGSRSLNDIHIKNCSVHGVRGVHGISVYAYNDLSPVNDLSIEECRVYDCECGSSESVVLNGNIDGFLIAGNTIHDNNNIGIDMIGFEGLAKHPGHENEKNPGNNPYEADMARNGICRDNLIYNISSKGNPAYFENGEYDLCADGIYVDGGQDIEIFNNFVFNCDIGLEVATEHSPDDNELFKVSKVRVHDNIIVDCDGWTGLCFGGYDRDLGFTERCGFNHNTLVDNQAQIEIQRSRNNRVYANLIIGGETGVEFSEDCRKADMINEISGNVAAEIKDKESWVKGYGRMYSDRKQVIDGFRSRIEGVGSRFTPNDEMIRIYTENSVAVKK